MFEIRFGMASEVLRSSSFFVSFSSWVFCMRFWMGLRVVGSASRFVSRFVFHVPKWGRFVLRFVLLSQERNRFVFVLL